MVPYPCQQILIVSLIVAREIAGLRCRIVVFYIGRAWSYCNAIPRQRSCRCFLDGSIALSLLVNGAGADKNRVRSDLQLVPESVSGKTLAKKAKEVPPEYSTREWIARACGERIR